MGNGSKQVKKITSKTNKQRRLAEKVGKGKWAMEAVLEAVGRRGGLGQGQGQGG